MYTALIIIDVFLALAMIGLILIQHGKGADAGAAFGSGSSGTVFGASGSGSVLTKITTWLAVAFFAVTLGLSVAAKDRVEVAVSESKKPTSVVQEEVPAAKFPVESQSMPLVPVESAPAIPENIPQDPVPSSPIEGVTSSGDAPSIDDIPQSAPVNAN